MWGGAQSINPYLLAVYAPTLLLCLQLHKNFLLQGKGRMTTYWLLGEKNSETTSAEVTEVSASSLEATSQEQLLSQKGNTPSIGTVSNKILLITNIIHTEELKIIKLKQIKSEKIQKMFFDSDLFIFWFKTVAFETLKFSRTGVPKLKFVFISFSRILPLDEFLYVAKSVLLCS